MEDAHRLQNEKAALIGEWSTALVKHCYKCTHLLLLAHCWGCTAEWGRHVRQQLPACACRDCQEA